MISLLFHVYLYMRHVLYSFGLALLILICVVLELPLFVALADDYTPAQSNNKGDAQDLVICPCKVLTHLIWSFASPFPSCVSLYEAL